jgi:hypothetical protein
MSTLSSIGSNLSNKSSSKDNIPMSLLGLPIVDYGALPSKYKDIYIYSVWELLQWCAVVPPFKAPRTKATHLYQTKVVSSNPSYSEVYLIQHYVIKIVWFSLGTMISSTNKTDCHHITELLLKVALITISLTLTLFIRPDLRFFERVKC